MHRMFGTIGTKCLLLIVLATILTSTLNADDRVCHFRGPGFALTIIEDSYVPLPATQFAGGDEKIRDALAVNGIFNLPVNVCLVQTGGRNILVDTGNGGRTGKLRGKLTELGIRPDEITTILLTHAHGDHVNGLIDETGNCVFPKANVYIGEQEYKTSLSHMKKICDAYRDRIKTFQFEQPVADGFIGRKSTGHTNGHVCYQFGNCFFTGDMIHLSALECPYPQFSAVFDRDKPDAVRTRVQFLNETFDKKATVIGAHFPFPGIGRIEKKDGLFQFVPLPAGRETIDP